MQRVDLNEAEFYGTVSQPMAETPTPRPECLRCGSSLAGRSEGLQTIGGKLVRVYACRCGRQRRVGVAAG